MGRWQRLLKRAMVPKRVIFGEPDKKRGTFKPRWLTENAESKSLRRFSISRCGKAFNVFWMPQAFSPFRREYSSVLPYPKETRQNSQILRLTTPLQLTTAYRPHPKGYPPRTIPRMRIIRSSPLFTHGFRLEFHYGPSRHVVPIASITVGVWGLSYRWRLREQVSEETIQKPLITSQGKMK